MERWGEMRMGKRSTDEAYFIVAIPYGHIGGHRVAHTNGPGSHNEDDAASIVHEHTVVVHYISSCENS